MGRPHHLQDQEELSVPAGDEEWDDELRPRVRDSSGRVPLLHPGHGQGAEDVPPGLHLVAPRSPLLRPDLLLQTCLLPPSCSSEERFTVGGGIDRLLD